jgi:YD repeat-containing protein
MVAVITGNGLGLGNTSLTQLGQGMGGQAAIGQDGVNQYLNAANGNLVLQSADENIIFDGLSLNFLRTYNSQGQLSGDQGWQFGLTRSVNGLAGTLDTAGSTITRTGDDGSAVTYVYNTALGVYVSSGQSGAVDTLRWSAGSSSWTWTNAAASQTETYNSTGQLTALADSATGASFSFSYSGNHLTQIASGDGDKLVLDYNTSNQLVGLTIQEVPPGQSTAVTRQQVSYTYDSQGRLSSVTTTLGSDTNASSSSYATTYTYDGTSDRVASVTQSDGTTVSYTYTEDAQGVYQVTGITTGTGAAAQVLTLSYSAGATTVTNALGQSWIYNYNAAGQLTQVTAPAVNGTTPMTQYSHDANGNLVQSTDPNGAISTYTYDANGNLVSAQDGSGNTVSTTYNSNDQVLSRTTYIVPAQGQPGQSGYVAPSGAQTTYFIYDTNGELAYTVDALGHVAENTYTSTGMGTRVLSGTRQYANATYGLTGLSPDTPPTLASLQAWEASAPVQAALAQSTLTTYTHDARGQLATKTQWDVVDSEGNGVLGAGTVITATSYSAEGRLLQTSVKTGANRATLQTASYAYDGLGRLISSTDPLGNVTSYVYTDSANTLTITQANGLVTTQVRNSAGQLISTTPNASAQSVPSTGGASGTPTASAPTGTIPIITLNTQDSSGQVRAVIVSGFTVINADGTRSTIAGEFIWIMTYDSEGRQTGSVLYATPLTAAQISSLIASPTLAQIQSLITPSASDQIELSIYDSNSVSPSPIATVNYYVQTLTRPDGSTYPVVGELVSINTYASNGTRTVQYANPISVEQVRSLGVSATLEDLEAIISPSTSDVTTQVLLDSQGREYARIAFSTQTDASGNPVAGEYLTTTTGPSGSISYPFANAVQKTYLTPLTETQVAAFTASTTPDQIQALIAGFPADRANLSIYDSKGLLVAEIDNKVNAFVGEKADGAPIIASGYFVTTYTYSPGSNGFSVKKIVTESRLYSTPLTPEQLASLGDTPTLSQVQALISAKSADLRSISIYNDTYQYLLASLTPEISSGPDGQVAGYSVALNQGGASELTTYATAVSAAQVAVLGDAPTVADLSALAKPSDNDSVNIQFNNDGVAVTITARNVQTENADGSMSSTVEEYVTTTRSISSAGGRNYYYNMSYATPLTPAQAESLGAAPTWAALEAMLSPSINDLSTTLRIFDSTGLTIASVLYETYDTINPDGSISTATGEFLTTTGSGSNGIFTGQQLYTTPLTAAQMAVLASTPGPAGLALILNQGSGAGTGTGAGTGAGSSEGSSGSFTYIYNASGQQVALVNPDGDASYTFYDADGRVSGTVDGDGNVVTFAHDADGNLTQTTQYSTPVYTDAWLSDGALTGNFPTSLPTPASTSSDRVTYQLYDMSGRVAATIDAEGNVTTTTFDGAGNAIATRQYAAPLTTAQINALGIPPVLATLQAEVSSSTSDRLTQTLYDADNRAIATIDAGGYVTVVTYDDAGRAVRTAAYASPLTVTMRSNLGAVPTLQALQADLFATAQDQTTRSYYDAAGRPVAQIDADGYLTVTAYDESSDTNTTTRYATALTTAQLGALTGGEDVSTLISLLGGNTASEQTSATYDADGRTVASTAIDGTVMTYTHDSVGDVLSSTVTPVAGQGAARTSSATYDALGDMLTSTDPTGATTRYAYDAMGRQIQTTDANGNTTYTYYDADGRVAYVVRGQPSGGVLNALGDVTAYNYTTFGQVSSIVQYANQLALTSDATWTVGVNPTIASLAQMATAVGPLTVSSSETDYTYTLDGQVVSTVDGDGYQIANNYDAFGDLVQVQQQLSQPGQALSASNSTTSHFAYDVRGERTGETDGVGTPAARSTASTYDAFGRVTSRTTADGSTVTYSYDALGQQVAVDQVVGGVARDAHTTYDAFGNVLTQTDALGNATRYQYDNATHTVTITTPGGVTMTTVNDAYGDRVRVTDGDGNATQYAYDADGRLLSTTDALGHVSTNQYDADGDLVQSTDAAGHVVTYAYDASGQMLTQVVDPSGLDLVTRFAYDGEGRRISVTDPAGTVTTYTYDADGNTLTQVQDAGAGHLNLTTTYTYDGAGKALTVTVGTGTAVRTTQYVYDALERLSQTIVDPGAGQLALTTSYRYDADNNLISSTEANSNATTFVYDEAGERVFVIDPTGAVTQTSYDADGHVTLVHGYATPLSKATQAVLGSTPSATAVANALIPSANDSYQQNVYNADGEVAYVISGTGLNVTGYTYNAAGQVTETRQYAAALSTGSIDPRATASTIAELVTASDNDIVTRTAYDADGQAIYRIDGAGDVVMTSYDAMGHVTAMRAYATLVSAAALDALGASPTADEVAAVVVSSPADRSTKVIYDSVGRAVYTIDAAGAVTQRTYDADGRVTSTHVYATALTAIQLTALGAAPDTAQVAAAVVAGSADQVSYTVYDAAGEPRYSIDPMGSVTETRYDTSGLISEVLAYANPLNTSSEASSLQDGTALGWISSVVGGASGTNADDIGEATLYLYDGAGRQRFIARQNQGGSIVQVTEQRYDTNGNVVTQIVYGAGVYLGAGSPLIGHWTTDSLSAQLAGTPASGEQASHTVYDADNRAIYVINAANGVTQVSYDALGHVIETQQFANPITLPATLSASTVAAAVAAAGGATGARIATTTYDAQGRVVSMGDALGISATYTYNPQGQKTSVTNRDGATTTFSYDSDGRQVLAQSAATTVGSYNTSGALQSTAAQYLYTTTTYTTFGEVASVSQGSGPNPSAITNLATTSYTYDAAGNRVATTTPGNVAGQTITTHVVYNALGQAVASQDGNGRWQYSVYDVDGRVSATVDSDGYVTAYTYDAYGNQRTQTGYATALNKGAISGWSDGQALSAGQLHQGLVTSSSDRTITTVYDQLNQKSEVTQKAISYYNAASAQVETAVPTTFYSYDGYGNLTSTAILMSGASGQTGTAAPVWAATYTYHDAMNRVVMTVDPMGYVTTTAYSAWGDIASNTQYAQAIATTGLSTVSMPGLPAAPTQATGGNRITSYTYDALGRKTSETDTGSYNYSGGTVGQIGGVSAYTTANSVTSYAYNGENQVTSTTVNGATTTTAYDALGRIQSVTGPARQVLVSNWAAILESTPGDDLTTAALYTSVSPVTSYVYDALGDVLSTTVSAGGLSEQTQAHYNALGRQTMLVDADGNTISAAYDNNGNLTSQSSILTDNGGSSTVITSYTYDADNRQLSAAVQRGGQTGYDSYTQQTYNAFGQVTAQGDNLGYEAQYAYDTSGNRVSAPDTKTGAVHTYGYDLSGVLLTDNSLVSAGAGSTYTHYAVDLDGRTTGQRSASENTASGENLSVAYMTFDRWGNVTSCTDALGNVTTYQYDSQNHQIQETEANVMVVSATGVRTWASPTKALYYNIDGQLMATTDENGNMSWNSYDPAGNLTMTQDATGAKTYTAYDALGRAVARQTPPVQTMSGARAPIAYTTYNGLNQVTGQGIFQLNVAGTARTQSVQQTYVLNSNGDRVQVTDALGHTTYYTYDSQHRVLQSQTPLQHANGQSTTYAYDVNGHQVAETDADGYHQSWVYDYFGRIQSHVDESGAAYNYTYDANSGLLTSETSNWTPTGPSAAVTANEHFTYMADGQIATVSETVGGVNSSYGYQYDADDNEILETDTAQDGGGAAVATKTVITYDSHNRLQEVTDENATGTVASMRTVYNYDAVGNRRAVLAQNTYDVGGTAGAPISLSTAAPTVGVALGTQTAQPAQALNYTIPAGSFTDPLGMGMTYTLSGAVPSWLAFNSTTLAFTGTPPAGAATYSFTVTATDALGRSVSSVLTINVPLVAPVFAGGEANQIFACTNAFSFTVPPASDANGLPVTYTAGYYNGSVWTSLPSWLTFNAATRTFSGNAPLANAGNYTLAVWAQGTGSPQSSVTFNLAVVLPTAPAFTAAPANQSATATTPMAFAVPGATDSNGFPVTYTAGYYNGSAWVALPSWLSFNATTRVFSGTPPVSAPGSYLLAVWANDTLANTSSAVTFSLTVNSLPPVQVNGNDIYFTHGFNNSVPIDAYFSNPMGRPLNYSLVWDNGFVPPGVAYNAATGILTGTAGSLKIEQDYFFTVTATDPVDGLSVTSRFELIYQANMFGAAAFASPVENDVAQAAATASTANVQAQWFTYDQDGRVLVNDGSLSNGNIVITDAQNSASNGYDAAGDETVYTTVNAAGQTLSQKNFYDVQGQLTTVQTQTAPGGAFATYESRSYDADGRQVSDAFYNLPGHTEAGIYNGSTISFSDAGWIASDTIYTYDISGNLTDQSTYEEDSAQDLINAYGTGVASSAYASEDQTLPGALPAIGANTDGALLLVTEENYAASAGYGYDADGNLLGYHITTTANRGQTASTGTSQTSYVLQNGSLNKSTSGTSGSNTNTYNDLGELIENVETTNGTTVTNTMAYSAAGQIIQKTTSGQGTGTFMYAEGQGLGSMSNQGAFYLLNTSSGFSNSDLGTQSYVAQAGDTLQSLAQSIYGDSNYAYIIAGANGLQIDSTLVAGMTLEIPQVTTSANNTTTFEPYKQNAIVNASPTSCVTTAQLVTNSIEMMLNQQSVSNQMIAGVEAAQTAEKAAQAAAAQQAAAAAAQAQQIQAYEAAQTILEANTEKAAFLATEAGLEQARFEAMKNLDYDAPIGGGDYTLNYSDDDGEVAPPQQYDTFGLGGNTSSGSSYLQSGYGGDLYNQLLNSAITDDGSVDDDDDDGAWDSDGNEDDGFVDSEFPDYDPSNFSLLFSESSLDDLLGQLTSLDNYVGDQLGQVQDQYAQTSSDLAESQAIEAANNVAPITVDEPISVAPDLAVDSSVTVDNVPQSISPIAGPQATPYTVQPGDTLSGIAGTSDPATIGMLMAQNQLTTSTIQPGMQLQVGDLGDFSQDQVAQFGQTGQAVLNSDNASLASSSASLDNVTGSVVGISGAGSFWTTSGTTEPTLSWASSSSASSEQDPVGSQPTWSLATAGTGVGDVDQFGSPLKPTEPSSFSLVGAYGNVLGSDESAGTKLQQSFKLLYYQPADADMHIAADEAQQRGAAAQYEGIDTLINGGALANGGYLAALGAGASDDTAMHVAETAASVTPLILASVYNGARSAAGTAPNNAGQMPLGFANQEGFNSFATTLNQGVADAGYENTLALFQGSSVTGVSFRTGEPFDVGRVSDYDIALAGDDIFGAANDLGISLRGGGVRTGPLSSYDLGQLGLLDIASDLGQQAGRPVNFMIYNSPSTAINRSPSILVPNPTVR